MFLAKVLDHRLCSKAARAAGSMCVFGAVCLIAAEQPAVAQLAPGYSGYSSAPEQGSELEYWFMLRQLGDCVANTKTVQAEALLAAPVDSKAEARAFSALFGGRSNSCMRNFVSATIVRSQVRGVIAEGLFKRNLRNGQVVRPSSPVDKEVATLHQFARCYIARQPAEAQRLLKETVLKSDEEMAMVQALSSTFAQCLPDRKVSLDASDVRLAFAEALYHASQVRND